MKSLAAAAALLLVVVNVHSGACEETTVPTTTSSSVAATPTQAIEGNSATSKATIASLTAASGINSTMTSAEEGTALAPSSNATGKDSNEETTVKTVSVNKTDILDANSTLPAEHRSSSTPSVSGTQQVLTESEKEPQATNKPNDYSEETQTPLDSALSTIPTMLKLESTRYIAIGVMVPVFLVGAVSFIVWKACQSDSAGPNSDVDTLCQGGDQNTNPKYVSKTGTVQLLSVKSTAPQADVK
ncbi:uncharacterized protein [Ambystoma mexicanum]|uniref:uncharacterized protein isoform X1 n=1 Tax=Ambystoma mexicanum TaxID=8296 RepID=UPI0037E81224